MRRYVKLYHSWIANGLDVLVYKMSVACAFRIIMGNKTFRPFRMSRSSIGSPVDGNTSCTCICPPQLYHL